MLQPVVHEEFHGHGCGRDRDRDRALQVMKFSVEFIEWCGATGLPWRNRTLIMFNASPTQPMIRTNIGFSTSNEGLTSAQLVGEATGILCNDTNRSTDWRNMLTPSARRKTPLKNAPRSCALCQPYDRA